MNKSKKKLFLLAPTTAIVVTCGVFLSLSKNVGNFSYVKASNYNLVLDSNTEITGLGDTPSNGLFTTKTSLGSDINWEYNGAKANATGLLTLVRTEYGNNLGNDGFLANTSPITSIENIDIEFEGSYVSLYGSVNGVDYERVKTVSTSGTYTDLKNYFYVKICSGNQDKSDLKITSVSISYSCEASNYTPEFRDSILNPNGKIDEDDNGLPLMSTTDHVFDATRSTTALKINQNFKYSNIYNKYAYIKLNNDVLLTDASNSKLTFMYSTSDDAKFASADDGTTAKTNFTVSIKLLDKSWKEVASTLTTSTFNAGVSYTKCVIDLSNKTWSTGKTEISVLRVSINRVLTAGEIYLDDFHFEEIDSYPSMSYHFNYPTMNETNDISNGTISIAYGGVTDNGEDTEFVAPAREGGESTKSRKTTISSDWKMWNYGEMADDLKNKEITFDLLAADVTADKTANIILQFVVGGKVYKTKSLFASDAETGITKTTVIDANSNSWTRVTIDASEFASHSTPTESTHIGFNFGYAKVLYVDNIFIGEMEVD